jgi:hypothetical protein
MGVAVMRAHCAGVGERKQLVGRSRTLCSKLRIGCNGTQHTAAPGHLTCFDSMLQGAKWLARRPKLRPLQDSRAWRHVCAVAAAVNIAGLMAANLAGFVVGPAGLVPLLRELVAQPMFVCTALFVFYSAAHLMFALREREAATGRRKCPVDALQKTL